MTGVRAKGWGKVRNMKSERAVCLVGGLGGQRLAGRLLLPGGFWALPKAFTFCTLPRTVLVQFLSDLGPSFAV